MGFGAMTRINVAPVAVGIMFDFVLFVIIINNFVQIKRSLPIFLNKFIFDLWSSLNVGVCKFCISR